MAYKMAVANIKGGVTKTTTAVNIADQLMERGYRVLLIDLDPQLSSTIIYEAKTDGVATLEDFFKQDVTLKECIQSTDFGDIVPCDRLLSEPSTRIPIGPLMYNYLKNGMNEIENDYDYIIIDTPPAFNILWGNALNCVNGVIVPFTCDSDAINGAIRVKGYVDEFSQINPNLKIIGELRVLYQKNLLLTRKINEDIPTLENFMKAKVFNTCIRICSKAKEANTLHQRLSVYNKKNNAYEDYSALVDEMLKEVSK